MDCPKCNGSNIGDCIYGPPWIITSKMQEMIQSGKIRMGGCIFHNNAPTNYCMDCNFEWIEKNDVSNPDFSNESWHTYLIKLAENKNYGCGKIFNINDTLVATLKPGTEPNAEHIILETSDKPLLHIKQKGRSLGKKLEFTIEDENEKFLAHVSGEKTSPTFTVKFQLDFNKQLLFAKESVNSNEIHIFEKKGFLQKKTIAKISTDQGSFLNGALTDEKKIVTLELVDENAEILILLGFAICIERIIQGMYHHWS
ncbi:hypothetical protein Nisw_07805 [Candidatus Nitrosopumilus sp. SW]|uniref:hypothetical protein n=1 Tax=Candidatus Nitrosopumilus sp. SW TaxID=2508726 RepID=UPI001151D658|nr:hypothetical protein [Candidatus Nitrosopumilus sp. SW]QDI89434.1 hypothetical protein Nisw_07805 [Candidatus Nitrosopumilus sp. SW]